MKRRNALSTLIASMIAISPAAMAGPAAAVLDAVTDAAHGRAYALLPEGVEVRDAGTGRRIALVPIPGWTRVKLAFSCPPALAVAPDGGLLVTSNAVPTLWRIEYRTLAVSVHEPRLEPDSGREPGFVALRWSREARAYVATAQNGERWRIDRSLESARRLTGAGAGAQDRECILPEERM